MNRTFVAVVLLCFCAVIVWRVTAPAIPEKEDVEALQVAVAELLPIALEQEKAERASLLKEAQARSQRVANYVEGTPTEIESAHAQLAETTRSFEEESVALRAPAESAAARIEEAVARTASFVGDMGLHRRTSRCGMDGCGGQCDACPLNQLCVDLFCHCVPACENRECGSDGCGGRCGAGICGEEQRCDDTGRCVALETEESCKPNCRTEPSGPRSRVIAGQKDHGESRQGAMFRPHPSRDATMDIRDRLASEAQELEAQTQAHRDRSAKIRSLQESQLPALQKTVADLNRTLAKRRDELKSNDTTDPVAKNALQVLSQKVEQARSAMKDTRKALTLLQKAHAKDERKMTSMVDAQRRLAVEAARLTAHLTAWDIAIADLEEARAAQSLAIQAAMAPLAALAAKWEPRISTAQGEVNRVKSPALDPVALDWDNDSPTHAVSRRVLRLTEGNALTRFQAGVTRLHAKYAAWWSSASPENREAHPTWQHQISELAGLLVYLDELSASTKRVVELRDALLHARAQSAR